MSSATARVLAIKADHRSYEEEDEHLIKNGESEEDPETSFSDQRGYHRGATSRHHHHPAKNEKMRFLVLLFIGSCIGVWALLLTQTWMTAVAARQQPPQQQHDEEKKSNSRFECYSLERDLSSALKSQAIEQTYIAMPAKASGQSLQLFADRCTGVFLRGLNNFMNQPALKQEFFHSSLEIPPLVASHVSTEKPLLDLIRYSTSKSLIIYMYRAETDRMMSAIRYVLAYRICGPEGPDLPEENMESYKKLNVTLSTTEMVDEQQQQQQQQQNRCVVSERAFLNEFVAKGLAEIGQGTGVQLGCNLWKEVDETAPPNMLFVHYTQSDALQEQLGAHYCNNTAAGLHENIPTHSTQIYLQGGGKDGQEEYYDLEEWLHAKRSTIEYAYELNGGSCKRELRMLDKKLESCPVVQVFPSNR